MRRSARRQTVRAKSRAAETGFEPGIAQPWKSTPAASSSRTAASTLAVMAGVSIANPSWTYREWSGGAVASSPITATRSFWRLSKRSALPPGAIAARASPMAALSSSTAPQASTDESDLETRRWYINTVIPWSPVLVTIDMGQELLRQGRKGRGECNRKIYQILILCCLGLQKGYYSPSVFFCCVN